MVDNNISRIDIAFDQYVIDGLVVMGQCSDSSPQCRTGRRIDKIHIAIFIQYPDGIGRRGGIEITGDDGEVANAVVTGKVCNDLCLGGAYGFPAVVEMGVDHGEDGVSFCILQYGKNGNAWKDGSKKTAILLFWCFG